MISRTLRLLGSESEANTVDRKWKEVMENWGEASTEYQYAFPDQLLDNIAEVFLTGIKGSGLIIATSPLLGGKETDVRAVLNLAWKNFWILESKQFRDWEVTTLQHLRAPG